MTSPPAPTTPVAAGSTWSFGGQQPLGSGGAAATGVCAVHVPSPLGRDQPHQQARAAAMQEHIRSRSLNKFQMEQWGLGSGSASAGGSAGGGGGATAGGSTAGLPSPFGTSPPGSPHGATARHSMMADPAGAAAASSALVAIPTAMSMVTSGGGGSGVSGGGAFGNRLEQQQQLSPLVPMRGPSYNTGGGGTAFRAFPYCGMGSVQCGGAAVTSPSPLGLRDSRCRQRSDASSGDTGDQSLPLYMGRTSGGRPEVPRSSGRDCID